MSDTPGKRNKHSYPRKSPPPGKKKTGYEFPNNHTPPGHLRQFFRESRFISRIYEDSFLAVTLSCGRSPGALTPNIRKISSASGGISVPLGLTVSSSSSIRRINRPLIITPPAVPAEQALVVAIEK
jgi:hypothetical protein